MPKKSKKKKIIQCFKQFRKKTPSENKMSTTNECYFTQLLQKKLSLEQIQKKPIKEREEFCFWLTNQFQLQLPDLINLGPVADENCNSCVSMAYETNSKTLVIVKKNMHNDGSFILPLNTLYELAAYNKIKHLKSLHLPKLIGVRITEFCTNIISEYIPVSFHKLFDNYQSEFIDLKINELISTVELLHTNNIAHRDIKSSNIRFLHNSCLVLLDFDSVACNQKRKTLPMVTLNNRAPELIIMEHTTERFKIPKQEYDAFACDWWSVGCVLAEMFLGESLFHTNEKTHGVDVLHEIQSFCLKLFSKEGISPLKRRMPNHLYELLQCLLQENPETRMKKFQVWRGNRLI